MEKNMVRTWVMVAAVVIMSVGEKGVAAEAHHHVVGDDRGWDPSTDMGSWSSGRTFRVGDRLWFAYSASHGTIAELKTQKEYLSCDASNPIKILSDGIDSILLDGEGIRYFVSKNLESCKNGLKLPVEVISQAPDDTGVNTSESSASAVAAGPTPSSSGRLGASVVLLIAGFWLSYMLI